MRVRASSYCQMDDREPFLTSYVSHSHSRLSAEIDAPSAIKKGTRSGFPPQTQLSFFLCKHAVKTCWQKL
uniref:Uncharacterized protein n=1 Tax=Caenorhabditis japonica TaxID=281687 RepID=A0A8R1EDD5_CAEJA